MRTAAASVSRVITKSRSTWVGLNSPAWMASCGCAGRVIFGDTHRGGAPYGTHYLIACAAVGTATKAWGRGRGRLSQSTAWGPSWTGRTARGRRARVPVAGWNFSRPAAAECCADCVFWPRAAATNIQCWACTLCRVPTDCAPLPLWSAAAAPLSCGSLVTGT